MKQTSPDMDSTLFRGFQKEKPYFFLAFEQQVLRILQIVTTCSRPGNVIDVFSSILSSH